MEWSPDPVHQPRVGVQSVLDRVHTINPIHEPDPSTSPPFMFFWTISQSWGHRNLSKIHALGFKVFFPSFYGFLPYRDGNLSSIAPSEWDAGPAAETLLWSQEMGPSRLRTVACFTRQDPKSSPPKPSEKNPKFYPKDDVKKPLRWCRKHKPTKFLRSSSHLIFSFFLAYLWRKGGCYKKRIV